MTDSRSEAAAIKTIERLLTYYNFQDEVQSREQLLDSWLRSYPIDWVRAALIEALYQGRYKSASVDYLLQLWKRREQSVPHFTNEFERLVSHNCPRTFLSLLQIPETASTSGQTVQPQAVASLTPQPISQSEERFQDSLTELEQVLQDDALLSELAEFERPMPDVTVLQADITTVQTENSDITALEELVDHLVAEALPRKEIPCRVNSTTPIHRFKPNTQPSDLYTKLAAMANTHA